MKLQNLKYANAFANLSKQILQDIVDMVDACNQSDQPFDELKTVLLGQFSKSKWQSYFELLCLPLEMQGLKPSILMSKLKQSLPPDVGPNNDMCVSHLTAALHARGGLFREPQDSRSNG
jgi:hypothetical protein